VFIGPAGIKAVGEPCEMTRLGTAVVVRDYNGKEGGAREGESWKKNSS